MKLIFDARYIEPTRPGGVSRFTEELARAAYAIDPSITFLVWNSDQIAALPVDANTVTVHAPTSWREPFTALRLNRLAPDVVFSPMQTIGSLGRRFALVLTVHDTIYYRYRTPPRNFSPILRLGWRIYYLWRWPQRFMLNRASAITTVSETSRLRILEAGLTSRPVSVIPNAALASPADRRALEFFPSVDPPRDLLYMGTFLPYKNVATLVRGVGLLPGYRLHLLSQVDPDIRAHLIALARDPQQLVFHDGVSDAEYFALLAAGSVLVSASLDEGYGLPIAEGIIHNAPAVVSDIPVFHETAGDAALFFDPRSPHSFAESVRMLDDLAVRERLATARDERPLQTWSESAARLVDICRKLTETRG